MGENSTVMRQFDKVNLMNIASHSFCNETSMMHARNTRTHLVSTAGHRGLLSPLQ